MNETQGMTAEQFADEVLYDLLNGDLNYQNPNIQHGFSPNVFESDPDLKVLKAKLKENGFELVKVSSSNSGENYEDRWKIYKI